MKALGLVETNGLIASIEALDVMLKTAEVKLYSKEFVGGGLVTVTVVGDVGAVKTAIDAADGAVKNLSVESLCSTHVIPRPDESVQELFPEEKEIIKLDQDNVEELMKETKEQIDDVKSNNNNSDVTDKAVEDTVSEDVLNNMKVVDLRNMAKKHPDFPITKKDIYRVNKEKLIKALVDYFNKD